MGKNKIISIFSVFLVFILFIALKPGDNPVLLTQVVSIATAVIFAGMILYTRILWKVAPFNKLHKVVDIGGKWQGKIMVDGGDVIDMDAHIVQYLDSIKIRVKTNDFYNDSLVCKMSSDSKGTKLYVVYKSKPNGKLGSIDQIEYGTLIISCDEDYLEGLFYTSTTMTGRVELYRK